VRSVDTATSGSEVRVLIAEDDAALRTLYVCLFEEIPGVQSVVEAQDGAEAVAIAAEVPLEVAVLDFNMPLLNGVDAALRMGALQPSLRIALHSSDPSALRDRAHGLGLPLFDKLHGDRLTAWVEEQAAWWASSKGLSRAVVGL
jgi:CheY-like chemotaxis protein